MLALPVLDDLVCGVVDEIDRDLQRDAHTGRHRRQGLVQRRKRQERGRPLDRDAPVVVVLVIIGRLGVDSGRATRHTVSATASANPSRTPSSRLRKTTPGDRHQVHRDVPRSAGRS